MKCFGPILIIVAIVAALVAVGAQRDALGANPVVASNFVGAQAFSSWACTSETYVRRIGEHQVSGDADLAREMISKGVASGQCAAPGRMLPLIIASADYVGFGVQSVWLVSFSTSVRTLWTLVDLGERGV